MPNIPSVNVSSPILKFFIGALAGVSVVALPRLTSYFTSIETGPEISAFFPDGILIAMLIFSIFLGLLIVIWEYKLPKPPKETFFAALAIPGLIAGSLNTAAVTSYATAEHNKATQLAHESLNIDEHNTIEQFEFVPLPKPQSALETKPSSTSFSIITKANAAETHQTIMDKDSSLNFSIGNEKKNYFISLGHFNSKAKAISFAQEVQAKEPSATIIKTKRGFDVLHGQQLLSKTDAAIEMIRIKRELGIQPKAIKLK